MATTGRSVSRSEQSHVVRGNHIGRAHLRAESRASRPLSVNRRSGRLASWTFNSLFPAAHTRCTAGKTPVSGRCIPRSAPGFAATFAARRQPPRRPDAAPTVRFRPIPGDSTIPYDFCAPTERKNRPSSPIAPLRPSGGRGVWGEVGKPEGAGTIVVRRRRLSRRIPGWPAFPRAPLLQGPRARPYVPRARHFLTARTRR